MPKVILLFKSEFCEEDISSVKEKLSLVNEMFLDTGFKGCEQLQIDKKRCPIRNGYW